MKQVLIIDRTFSTAYSLHSELLDKGFVITTVSTEKEAFTQIETHSPDIVILDMTHIGLSGCELCSRIREQGYVTLPILILTTNDAVDETIAALNSGADQCMKKPCHGGVLVAHIRAMLRRTESVPKPRKTVQIADLWLDTESRCVYRAGEPIELTRREYDLLELLAQNAGRALTKERIFERVWEYTSDVGLEVIKVYITYLRAKLNTGGKANLIHVIRGVGYTFKPEPATANTFPLLLKDNAVVASLDRCQTNEYTAHR